MDLLAPLLEGALSTVNAWLSTGAPSGITKRLNISRGDRGEPSVGKQMVGEQMVCKKMIGESGLWLQSGLRLSVGCRSAICVHCYMLWTRTMSSHTCDGCGACEHVIGCFSDSVGRYTLHGEPGYCEEGQLHGEPG